ncbi:sulfatase family protein [Desulforhopalus sp. 52FAK]
MVRRIFFISAALVLFSLLVQEGMEQYRKVNQISVILLTVESLRQDMVGSDTTPNLLQALEDGYRSLNHRAVSGWTGTNMISLLSGLSPFETGVHTRGQSVDENLELPLKILNQRGYRVAGLQGFMTMDLYGNLGLDTSDVGSDPIFWLTERGLDGEPFFLWEHYIHTHLPYRPGREYHVDMSSIMDNNEALERVNTAIHRTNIPVGSVTFQPEDLEAIHALHEANVREFDDWFADFWEFFRKSGLSTRTVLIVTADHGDEHGERGNVGHASTNGGGHLHEEIVRVPLFFWLPEKLRKQRYTATFQQSNHMDVMVTLFSLLDISLPEMLQGRDFFNSSVKPSWYGMTSGGGFREKDPDNIQYYEYGMLDDGWKLLWRIESNGKEERRLYNLKDDPREQYNLALQHPETMSRLQNALKQKIATAHQRRVDPRIVPRNDGLGATVRGGPQWVFPEKSGQYVYEDFEGGIYLQWQGDDDADYILQYKVGKGESTLDGQLEIRGIKKDFGRLSKRYWNTWIVPASPLQVRVRRDGQGGWSDWLILEPQP